MKNCIYLSLLFEHEGHSTIICSQFASRGWPNGGRQQNSNKQYTWYLEARLMAPLEQPTDTDTNNAVVIDHMKVSFDWGVVE